MDHQGRLPPAFQQHEPGSFFPKQDSTIEEAYPAVVLSLQSRKERYHDGLKVDWKARLEELMFEGMNWTQEKQHSFITNWMGPQTFQKNKPGVRWQTSLAIDRATHSSFIQYFAKRFLGNPLSCPMDGEIVCLLWIMTYVAQAQIDKLSLQSLLNLTSQHLEDGLLCFDDLEVELSTGLTQILQAYIGNQPSRRHQKLFPHLTIDKLEDCFRKASRDLLPPGETPILPEAFLIFPHNLKNVRMRPSMRRRMQASPPKVYQQSISRQEIARQLRDKKRPKTP